MKNPLAQITYQGALDLGFTTKQHYHGYSPSQVRVVIALMERPHTRKELDLIAGVADSTKIISVLRRKGLDIFCDREWGLDKNDNESWHGRYSLSYQTMRSVVRHRFYQDYHFNLKGGR